MRDAPRLPPRSPDDRRRADKRVTAQQAAGLVGDGDHVAIGGTLYSRTPMALLLELLRAGRRDLVLSRPLASYEMELFLATGGSRHILTSWVGIGLRWGISRVLRELVEDGQVRFEEWSHLALGLRYKAGAMGVPFLPTRTMLGSDLARQVDTRTMVCPFTGETVLAVPALIPDVALLHAHRADPAGNCQIDGYAHMDPDMARAARTVVVSAERIVTPAEIRRRPETTVIPHFLVDAVVPAPLGAFPHECYGLYEADFDHFDAYVEAIGCHGLDAVRSYVAANVLGGHEEFLATFGSERLEQQRRRARELTAL